MQKSAKKHRYVLSKLVTIKLRLLIQIILCIISFSQISVGKADELDPAMLKAIYTYKFGKFTQWPDKKLNSAISHFLYCILGQNPFPLQTLDLVTQESVQGIPITIEVFESGLIPKEVLSRCHIVFISRSEKHRLSTILTSLKNTPTLTVSDILQFSEKGGMITLVKDRGKLRFQVNQKVLQQANLSISSKIMELAEIIEKE